MQVPVYQQTVGQQNLPDARQNLDTSAATFIDPLAQQGAEVFGGALHHLSHDLINQAEQAQQEADRTRALEAENSLQTQINQQFYGKDGYFSTQGKNAFEGKDGKSGGALALQSLQDTHQNLLNGLQNDNQKYHFGKQTQALMGGLHQQILQHEGAQFRVYQKQTLNANTLQQQENIALNYNNPDLIGNAIHKTYENFNALNSMEGLPADVGHLQAHQAVSKAIRQAMDNAMQHNDYTSAQTLYDRHNTHLTAEDAEQARKTLVNNFVASMAQAAPEQLKQLSDENARSLAAIAQVESGNKNYQADGTPVTSPDGQSAFAMQTTHTTAANPGYGITPAQAKTADEYNRVAIEKHQVLTQHYNGDYNKVHAAYNWGEGNVDQLIEQYGNDWQDHLPASVKNYVDKTAALMKTHSPMDYATPKQTADANQISLSQLDNHQSVYRTNLQNTINDQLAQLQHTGKTGDMKTLADFEQVYPHDAQARYDQYLTNYQYSQNYNLLKNMPVAQATDWINSHQPAANASADAFKTFDALQKLVASKQTQLDQATQDQFNNLQQTLKRATPDEAQQLIDQFQQQHAVNGINDIAAAKHYEALQKTFVDVQQARNKDPLQFAQEQNYPIGQADLGNLDTLIKTLTNRVPINQQMQNRFNTRPAFLTQAETDKAQKDYQTLAPDDQYALLHRLANNNLPNDAVYYTLNSITPNNSITQMAAKMTQYPAMSDTAKTLLEGQALLDASKNGKQGLPLPNDNALDEALFSRMENAYKGNAQAGNVLNQYRDGIKAFYASQAMRTGKLNTDKTVIDSQLFDQAFDAVTGGLVKIGSHHYTFAPYGMDKDAFAEQAPSAIQAKVKALNLPGNWQNYDLMQGRRNGLYQLWLNGREIPNSFIEFK